MPQTNTPISDAASSTHKTASGQWQDGDKQSLFCYTCGNLLNASCDPGQYRPCTHCTQHEKETEAGFRAGYTGTPKSDKDSGFYEQSTQSHDETLHDRPSPEEWEEVLAGDRQHESDAMLAQAYHNVAEASRDIAIWSNATAVALEEKLAAARREYEAASQVMMATARYQQAVLGIEEAMAHRRQNTATS